MENFLTDDQLRRAEAQVLADDLRDLGDALVDVARNFDRLFGGDVPNRAVNGQFFDRKQDFVWSEFDDGLTELQEDNRLRDVWNRCKALQKRCRKVKEGLTPL